MNCLEARIKMPARAKPMTGDMSRALRTLTTCCQSNPEAPPWGDRSWLATPTPMMEPTMVCELDAGSPNHQVLRFQRMAAISRAKTMAKPAPELTWRINSTGSRVMMVKATRPEEARTPARFHSPDQITARLGSREWV